MNEVFLKALAARIEDGQMEIIQVPEVYREAVEQELSVN